MTALAQVAQLVALGGVLFVGYTYIGYPAVLWLVGRFRRDWRIPDAGENDWPSVSIVVPAYNEEKQIEGLIRSLISLEYPVSERQILIVSDGSTDRTDEIVSSFSDEGVELIRIKKRGGKTKAEETVSPHLRGDVIVNTDASIRFSPGSLKALIRAFRDPEVGLASGRDISVAPGGTQANVGESGYVGYEMAIRDLETRVSGIVGASGCFYAIRPDLHRKPLPAFLSRDFAAALHTREGGGRAVSVPEAVCFVPRTASLHREYRRKVRTIARGMDTLWHKRSLLNPFRHGLFAWMLFSHKVCRWLLPWVGLACLLAVGTLAWTVPWAIPLFGLAILALTLAGIGWFWSERSKTPWLFSIPAFIVMGNLAAAHAFIRFLWGDRSPMWEPTRRDSLESG